MSSGSTRVRLTRAVNDWSAIETATADLDLPFAIVDVAAFERNADSLVARAGGRPSRPRLASGV